MDNHPSSTSRVADNALYSLGMYYIHDESEGQGCACCVWWRPVDTGCLRGELDTDQIHPLKAQGCFWTSTISGKDSFTSRVLDPGTLRAETLGGIRQLKSVHHISFSLSHLLQTTAAVATRITHSLVLLAVNE